LSTKAASSDVIDGPSKEFREEKQDVSFATELDMEFFEEDVLTPKTFSYLLSNKVNQQIQALDHILKITAHCESLH
jgi:hypothetical protein